VTRGRRMDAHNYCAALLGWMYGSDPRVILEMDVYRILALDETSRRVLLGCQREGLLLEKMPSRKVRWVRINAGLYQHRIAAMDPWRKPPQPVRLNRADTVLRIERMMELAQQPSRRRFA
jgi:hypothetical protein